MWVEYERSSLINKYEHKKPEAFYSVTDKIYETSLFSCVQLVTIRACAKLNVLIAYFFWAHNR